MKDISGDIERLHVPDGWYFDRTTLPIVKDAAITLIKYCGNSALKEKLKSIIAKIDEMINEPRKFEDNPKAKADEVNYMIGEVKKDLEGIVRTSVYVHPHVSLYSRVKPYLIKFVSIVTFGAIALGAGSAGAEGYANVIDRSNKDKQKSTTINLIGGGDATTIDGNTIRFPESSRVGIDPRGNMYVIDREDEESSNNFRRMNEYAKSLDYDSLKKKAIEFETRGDYKSAIDTFFSLEPKAKPFVQRGEYNSAIEALIHAMKSKGIGREEQAEDLWHFGRVYTAVNKSMAKSMLEYVRDNYKDTSRADSASFSLKKFGLLK